MQRAGGRCVDAGQTENMCPVHIEPGAVRCHPARLLINYLQVKMREHVNYSHGAETQKEEVREEGGEDDSGLVRGEQGGTLRSQETGEETTGLLGNKKARDGSVGKSERKKEEEGGAGRRTRCSTGTQRGGGRFNWGDAQGKREDQGTVRPKESVETTRFNITLHF